MYERARLQDVSQPLDSDWRSKTRRAQLAHLPKGATVVSCRAPYGAGGLGRHLAELVEAVRSLGHAAFHLSPAPGTEAPGAAATAVKVDWATYLQRVPPVRDSPDRRLLLSNWAFDLAGSRRLPPADNLLVFNGHAARHIRKARSMGFTSASLVSANSHMAHVARQHEAAFRRYPIERPWSRGLVRSSLAEYDAADLLYVASRYVWDSFVAEGCPERRLRLFPLTPDDRFKASPEAVPSSTFDVVFVGALSVHKGVPLLIDAVRRLPHTDLRLVLVGGWGTRGMRKHVQSACRADRRIVVCPGDPLDHLGRAGVCAHPCYEDGFGYAPAEALACGVPVIVTQDTGMKELVRPGVDGQIMPTGDLDALTELIDCAYRGALVSPDGATAESWSPSAGSRVARAAAPGGPSPRDEAGARAAASNVAGARAAPVALAPSAGLRVLMVGRSSGAVCGVRDHATLLAEAMRAQGTDVRTVWSSSSGEGKEGLASFAAEITRTSRQSATDAVLLHYSVFAFAWRGVPFAVPLFALRLRRLQLPVVLLAHEYAYPWGRRGVKGRIQAISQRLVLGPLVAASSRIVVTTADRVRWFRACRWLPDRPVALAPVFSNIRPSTGVSPVAEIDGRVGVFSFGAEGLAADLVTRAMGLVAQQIPSAHLALIGAPGSDSEVGRGWRDAAAAAGCPITFTGVAGEAEVSRHLGACQVIVFPDPAGPTSRKTSLAAALAHGRPIVALHGPQRWEEVVAAGAVVVVEPAAVAVADRIVDLLSDHPLRASLGASAREFAEQTLSDVRIAVTVENVLRQAVDSNVSKRAAGALQRPALSAQRPLLIAARLAARAAVLSGTVVNAAPAGRMRALARLWRWQAARRFADGPALIQCSAGSRFALPLWFESGGLIVANGSHQPAVTMFLDRVLRAGDVVVDVGAKIGFHSVRCALAGAQVVAFEPAERFADVLECNARLADVAARVRVERWALAGQDGEQWWLDDGDVPERVACRGAGRRVPARRLDALADSIPVPDAGGLCVLKVDGEGADLQVIEGGQSFITRRRPVLLMEMWDGGGDVRALLESLGYDAFAPSRRGLEPLTATMRPANMVAVPEEAGAQVKARLQHWGARPLPPPRILSWGTR